MVAKEESARMTTDEVAQLLDVTPKAVYMAVYRGALRKARTGRGAGVLDRADVEAYLARRWRRGRSDSYWATVKEAAELLGVTPAWVRTLAQRGKLPAPILAMDGRPLFRRQQIEVIANARVRRISAPARSAEAGDATVT